MAIGKEMLTGKSIVDCLHRTGRCVKLVSGKRYLFLDDGIYGRTYTYSLALTVDGTQEYNIISNNRQEIEDALDKELHEHNYHLDLNDQNKTRWIVTEGSRCYKFKTREEAEVWIVNNQSSYFKMKLIQSDPSNTWWA